MPNDLNVMGRADFEAQLGELRQQVSKNAQTVAALLDRDRRRQRSIHAQPLASVPFPVASGVLQTPTAVSLLGPEDGQVWDIRLVTLAGWTTADAAIMVNLFGESALGLTASQGNPQNRLAKFNDAAAGTERWTPSGGLLLHSPDQLVITGSGFTTTTVITLNIRGVAMEQWVEPDYLL